MHFLHTPLYINILDSSTTKATYTWTVVLYMMVILFCLSFVKTALNESKGHSTETHAQLLDEMTASESVSVDDNGSMKSKKKKPSKMEIVAKAFLLDILFNAALLVVKGRKDGRRWAILLLLLINIIVNFMPFRQQTVWFTIGDSFFIDNYDFDAVILIIISVLILVLEVSKDTIVAVVAIAAPILAKLVIATIGFFVESSYANRKTDAGIYDNFFILQTFAVLFLIVERNEMSIYCVFVAALFISNVFKTVIPHPIKSFSALIIVGYVLLLVMVISFCFFVFLMKKIEAANEEKRKREISVGLKVFSAISKMKISIKKPTPSSFAAVIVSGNERKSEHQPNGNKMEGSSSETGNVGSGTETKYAPPANGDKLFSAVNKMKMALKSPTTSSS